MTFLGQSVSVSDLVKEAAQLIADQGWPEWLLVALIVVSIFAVTWLITFVVNAVWKRPDD
jgi:hypothetical protein